MNDRIKQLIMEAVNFRLDPDSDAHEAQVCPEDLEYLAKLIVQECVNVLHDNELWYRHISHVLKEHFGVEE